MGKAALKTASETPLTSPVVWLMSLCMIIVVSSKKPKLAVDKKSTNKIM